ncbi:MAG: hypothetical protein HPY50_19395 [Firmicutes bacterium]|nr:hypothetical protein [Bacillota bacterium]
MSNTSRRFYSIMAVFLAAAIGISSSIYVLAARGEESTGQQEDSLPVVGTLENLKKLLEQSRPQGYLYDEALPMMRAGTSKETANTQGAAPAPAADANDHSTTNLQVAGVDEADLVKTDGEYIYQVSKQQVVIARAYPPDQMSVASVIKYNPGQMTPQEIYLDESRLVVIGSAANNVYYEYEANSKGLSIVSPYPPYQNKQTMKAIVYDITDRANVKQIREVELEGGYLSSRKIDSALYLVAQKNIYYYAGQPRESDSSLGVSYRDSAAGSGFIPIGYDQIRYFPDFVEPNYVIIAGLDLNQPEVSAQTSVYLGAGDSIYASRENLYVAVTTQNYSGPIILKDLPAPASSLVRPISPAGQNTRVYRFALNAGQVTHKASGEVPGRVLNQFSMDEYQGNFRIATTRDDYWRSDMANQKSNSLYVLDDKLGIVGRLENIAPGEKIYSVRFMGSRGYLVTFEKVDPFFVVDLKEPQNPKLLGALKIPGYSDYLHPYDDDHIIGIGKDTVELPVKDWRGDVTGTQAYYLGMKMAIFDVTDVTQPREVFSARIGDRGTDSELLHNHKALLFSREKNLLAFPVTLMEVKDGQPYIRDGMSFPQYGSFSFQGAYVYRIDLQQGFQLRGRITHLTDEDYLKAGYYNANPDKNVERIVYINDTLYTLSPSMIKANAMSDLAAKGSLDIQ